MVENIKKIQSTIAINEYVINFSYETKRGNKKEQKRSIKALDEENAKTNFMIWLMTYNEDFSYRAMLNVKILSIEKINTSYITL